MKPPVSKAGRHVKAGLFQTPPIAPQQAAVEKGQASLSAERGKMQLEDWHLIEGDSFEERHLANIYAPLMEAWRLEDDPDRIERLRRVYTLAQSIFLLVEGRRLPQEIVVALHDHKGKLTVTFVDHDWQEFLMPFFQLAWHSEGESRETVVSAVQQ